MEKEKIIIGNRLIAEFMGVEPFFNNVTQKFWWTDGVLFNFESIEKERAMNAIVEYAKYHSSWDWLMSVIEKIENCFDGDVIVNISDESCSIQYMDKFKIYATTESKIQSTHISVIEFIEWYNNNKSK